MNRHLLAVVMLASSCAYVPRVVRLTEPAGRVFAPVAPCVAIEPLADARTSPERIGVLRNGLGWPTARARTDDDAAAWVTEFLRRALAERAEASCSLKLTGSLRDLFVDEYFNLEGRIQVSLRLERAGAVLLERDFTASHSQLSQLGSVEEFEETLRKTLEALGAEVVPAVREANERIAPNL